MPEGHFFKKAYSVTPLNEIDAIIDNELFDTKILPLNNMDELVKVDGLIF
jgi:hypothetical protein